MVNQDDGSNFTTPRGSWPDWHCAGGSGGRIGGQRQITNQALAAAHAAAPTIAATDWANIVALYDLLARTIPSPVVELNRAVAVAMRDGPSASLADYHLAHATRADLCRRLGRTAEARVSYH